VSEGGAYAHNLFAGQLKPQPELNRDTPYHPAHTTYAEAFGKSNPVRDEYNQLTLDLQQGVAPRRAFQLILRAYEDGVAYQVRVLAQAGVEQQVTVTDESTRFRLLGNPQLWPLFCENYTTSHEGRYTACDLNELDTNRLIIHQSELSAQDSLRMRLVSGGGQVVRLTPAR